MKLHKYKETGKALHKTLCGLDVLKNSRIQATAWENKANCLKCVKSEGKLAKK